MAAASIAESKADVIVGVDTHKDTHVGHAKDELGRDLGHLEVPTTARGYAALLAWARSHGEVVAFGVEGTSSYGIGLSRYLQGEGHLVLEVIRPRRRPDRRHQDRAQIAGLRCQALEAEARELEIQLDQRTSDSAPVLRSRFGVGSDSAAALLIAAGDNPARLRSDSSFSMLCGSSPLPASSGQTKRHRLNRGGDRQANAALHRIVMTRLRWHEPTKAYMARRLAEGKSKPEVIRCLKRYVAREIYTVLAAARNRA